MPKSTAGPCEFVDPERCPSGLEQLDQTNRLIIEKQIVDIDLLSRAETENKYVIKNHQGEQIFFAVEDTYSGRLPFDLKILDSNSMENIRICKKKGYYPGIQVYLPFQTLAATIENTCKIIPKYIVRNSSGEPVLKIKFPFLCKTERDLKGVVYENNKKLIGRITKIFARLNTYEITFPISLSLEMKAALLSACFLVQSMFFRDAFEGEKNAKQQSKLSTDRSEH